MLEVSNYLKVEEEEEEGEGGGEEADHVNIIL